MNYTSGRTFFSLFSGKVRFYRSDIMFEGDCYMERWILRTPWGDMRLHHILRSDNDRALHDHPFDFTSIMLWGSYREWLETETERESPVSVQVLFNGIAADHTTLSCEEGTWHYAPCILRRKAETLHRLELTAPVWTLVFTEPIRRTWGFKTLLHGWIAGDNYKGEP